MSIQLPNRPRAIDPEDLDDDLGTALVLGVEVCPLCDLTDASACPACDGRGWVVLELSPGRA